MSLSVQFPSDAAALRALFQKGDEARDAGLTTPAGVTRFDDIAYGPDPMQVMDIYCPAGTDKPLPTIVSIHGGGYVYGDKERYQFYCMDLALRGFTVVNFSYPLAPEHQFPEHLLNTNAAIARAVADADKYFIDPNNIFFVGDSAGAQMNSQYSAAVTNPAYAKLLGLEIPAIRLRAIALNCGMYDRTGDGDDVASCWYMGPLEQRSAETREKMNVLKYIPDNYPPSFVMSAYGDFLLENAKPFADFLTAKGIENELHIYGEKDTHELGHVFHCNIRTADAKQCNDEECAFFKKHIV